MPRTKDAPEVVEAEAEIIEEGIAPISGLDALIGEIAGDAERIAAEYLPRDIADEDDFKQSKRERTAARKSIAALKARYAERIGAVKEAVAEADFRMKSAIEPLDAIDRGYKAKVDEYTTRWTNNRIATLREAYEDFAPDLAMPQDGAEKALVPFHRLLGRYGNEKGAQWTSRTVGEIKATEAMYAAVEEIAKAEKTIDAMVEPDFREAAKARYFRTLDLQATLNEEAEAKAQRERVARLERERQERIATEEAARRKAEEDAWLEEQAALPPEPGVVRVVAPPSGATEATIKDGVAAQPEPIQYEPPRIVTAPPVPMAPAPFPAPMGQETGQETGRPAAPMEAPAGYAHEWTIAVLSATQAQMRLVADFMRANGVMFEKVYSGGMQAAWEKWRAENGR